MTTKLPKLQELINAARNVLTSECRSALGAEFRSEDGKLRNAFSAIKRAAKALPVSHEMRPIHHGLCDAGEFLIAHIAAINARAEQAERERDDDRRVLRASVPERWKDCTSAVGAAQSYIAELERERDALRVAEDEKPFRTGVGVRVELDHETRTPDFAVEVTSKMRSPPPVVWKTRKHWRVTLTMITDEVEPTSAEIAAALTRAKND